MIQRLDFCNLSQFEYQKSMKDSVNQAKVDLEIQFIYFDCFPQGIYLCTNDYSITNSVNSVIIRCINSNDSAGRIYQSAAKCSVRFLMAIIKFQFVKFEEFGQYLMQCVINQKTDLSIANFNSDRCDFHLILVAENRVSSTGSDYQHLN